MTSLGDKVLAALEARATVKGPDRRGNAEGRCSNDEAKAN
jgi:hypothetical protein